jgi:trafficking protein particle complex subunit 13
MCKIATPFIVRCRVTNTSVRSMELNLNFNTKPRRGQAYTGSSEQSLGIIEPEKCKEFTVTIFPARLGIINISDFQLTDVYMKRSYEFEDILQAFVVDDLNEAYDMQKYVKFHDIPVAMTAQTV